MLSVCAVSLSCSPSLFDCNLIHSRITLIILMVDVIVIVGFFADKNRSVLGLNKPSHMSILMDDRFLQKIEFVTRVCVCARLLESISFLYFVYSSFLIIIDGMIKINDFCLYLYNPLRVYL